MPRRTAVFRRDRFPWSMLKTTTAELPLPANPVALSASPILQSKNPPRILASLGLDRAVVFTLLARGWSALAGLVTLTLIARLLTRAQQGYYYTFYSLVALQIVFELGFSVVVLQTASHEAAHLQITASGSITGRATAHARLASVLQKTLRWYTAAGLAMSIVLFPLGYAFFHHQDLKYGTAVSWHYPWLLAVLATCLTFQIDPLFSFLEGCGFVWNVQRARFAQALAGSLLGWTALALHHGLFAPGCVIAGQAIAGCIFLAGKRNLLLPLAYYNSEHPRIDWGTEIWPFQWRIAVSWFCGYLTFQLFNPIVLNDRGPIEAGQMGMSMSICASLTAMAIAWMSTKAAPLGRLIALKDYSTLDRTFFRAALQSTIAAAIAFTSVWLIAQSMRAHHTALALRVLPATPLAFLFAAHIVNVVVFAEALYLRAHKQEKFMLNSIAAALWMAPTALIIGRAHGAYGIALCYFCGTIVIGLGYGTWTFTRYRSLWHGI